MRLPTKDAPMTDAAAATFAPTEIAFLKGMKSTAGRKVFKTQAAMDKWLAANGENITILAYSTPEA